MHLKMRKTEQKKAVTVGFFDGVHRGHQYLMQQLRQVAEARRLEPMVVTFEQHPRQVLSTDYRPQLLSTPAEKSELLRATGVGQVRVLAFDSTMAALPARDFMRQVLREELGAGLLLTGYDNRFGHRSADNATEGFDDYVGYGRELGIEVVRALPLSLGNGQNASSSLVRRLLAEGDAEGAAACLGRQYALSGTVVAGEHIGHRLGFPTANLRVDHALKMIPAAGVYAVWACTAGRRYPAMMNIGTRPTFNGRQQALEVHIIDFDGNLYGQDMTVCFVARLRAERPFDSAEALAQQLEQDKQATIKILQKI